MNGLSAKDSSSIGCGHAGDTQRIPRMHSTQSMHRQGRGIHRGREEATEVTDELSGPRAQREYVDVHAVAEVDWT